MIVTAICLLWVLPMIQPVIRVFVIFYTSVMMRVVSKMSVAVNVRWCLPRFGEPDTLTNTGTSDELIHGCFLSTLNFLHYTWDKKKGQIMMIFVEVLIFLLPLISLELFHPALFHPP